MTEAPIRDVVRVEERVGPRGGRTLVLHLSCGCFLTRSSKAPPPKRARCIPCSVLADISPTDPFANMTTEERQILGGRITIAAREREARTDRIAEHLVAAVYLYPNYRVDARGPRGCIFDALQLIAPEIAAEVEQRGWDAVYRARWSDDASARSNSRPNDA